MRFLFPFCQSKFTSCRHRQSDVDDVAEEDEVQQSNDCVINTATAALAPASESKRRSSNDLPASDNSSDCLRKDEVVPASSSGLAHIASDADAAAGFGVHASAPKQVETAMFADVAAGLGVADVVEAHGTSKVKEPSMPRSRSKDRRRAQGPSNESKTAQDPEKKKLGKKPKPIDSAESAKCKPDCPASRQAEEFDRDLKELKAKARGSKATSKASPKDTAPLQIMPIIGDDRDVKQSMFRSFYREQYARIAATGKEVALDTSQYEDNTAAIEGLSIKGGHRKMPRPKKCALPPDHRQNVGKVSPEELGTYNCHSNRILVCVHGDIFDVSDRPDKYSENGPYWEIAGQDITWALLCGNDVAANYNQYYDVFKIQPPGTLDRKLQGLCSWWAYYATEYGDPVGRLDVYEDEWRLPCPPVIEDAECVVM